MKNNLIDKLESNTAVIGTFFEIGGATAVECLGISGLDFLIIDSEHGPIDVESTLPLIRAAELKQITPLVRVKNKNRDSILKMLDIGAQGLVIPCIDSVDEVKKIVEYGKYAPIGSRGFFYGRVAEFGYGEIASSVDDYFETCNKETLILPQCETIGCLENIEEILNIDGVDGIFIGPYDLSIGMGITAQFKEPEFIAAIDRILNACKRAGKYAFIYTGNNKVAKNYLKEGFDGVAVNIDVSLYIQAFKTMIEEVKLEG